MAQWIGKFAGFTHDTKVQDLEISLRKAVEALRKSPEEKRAEKLKVVRSLARRLVAARLKAVRARIAMLCEPGNGLGEPQVNQARRREQELEAGGAEGVLKEFGA